MVGEARDEPLDRFVFKSNRYDFENPLIESHPAIVFVFAEDSEILRP